MIYLSSAVLVIIVMSGRSGVAITQVEFPSFAQCVEAQAQEFVWGGDYPEYPPDTRHFCIKTSNAGEAE